MDDIAADIVDTVEVLARMIGLQLPDADTLPERLAAVRQAAADLDALHREKMG